LNTVDGIAGLQGMKRLLSVVRETGEPADLGNTHCVNRTVLKGKVMCRAFMDCYVGLQGPELPNHGFVWLHRHHLQLGLLSENSAGERLVEERV
jgi:hypothetical protein